MRAFFVNINSPLLFTTRQPPLINPQKNDATLDDEHHGVDVVRVFSPRRDKDAIEDISSQSRIARYVGISSHQWLHESDCDCGDSG